MDRCPCCERELRSFRDFPRLYIEKFERRNIPSIIPSEETVIHNKVNRLFGKKIEPEIPKEVLKILGETNNNEISYKGRVYKKCGASSGTYYQSWIDATEAVKEALERKEIIDSLSAIENLVGKEIAPKDLISIGERSKITTKKIEYFSLYFYDIRSEISQLGFALSARYLKLPAELYDYDFIDPYISCELGKLNYEGRINNPETTESRKI